VPEPFVINAAATEIRHKGQFVDIRCDVPNPTVSGKLHWPTGLSEGFFEQDMIPSSSL